MPSCRIDNLAITIDKKGAGTFRKSGLPVRFGTYSEIRTSEYEFQFNLKGEIKTIRGLSPGWPHPSEWLKRTDGNDWVLYSVSRIRGIKQWLGEYYLPCLPYASNSILEFNPYTDSRILQAFAAWSQLYANLSGMRNGSLPPHVRDFLKLVSGSDENTLHTRSEALRSIVGGRVTVLPPDTRHVEYEVIPLTIADGCLYHCDFCSVQSDRRFTPRSMDQIRRQIRSLKSFYGRNLVNYKALFLGNHDALAAGRDRICTAAQEAFEAFAEGDAHFRNPVLFLFGSVDSLLKAENGLFETLHRSPYSTYINIGFESVDAATLAGIRKPLTAGKIRDAFRRMLEVNREYADVEITGNFLLGDRLPADHNRSLAELLGDIPDDLSSKGAIYLSPLMDSPKRDELLPSFFELKKASRLPVFIYLIQRL